MNTNRSDTMLPTATGRRHDRDPLPPTTMGEEEPRGGRVQMLLGGTQLT